MKKPVRKARSVGASLLEIVVAMNCMAMLLAMVCQVLPLARRQFKEADQKLGGAVLAQNVLEEYLTVPLAQWPSDPVIVEGEQQQVSLRVESWPADARLRKVRAVVMLGDEERYELSTLVFP